MKFDLDPKITAILEAQVAAGLYPTVAAAVTAAVLGAAPTDAGNLAWAKPYLAAADADIQNGQTFSEEEAFRDLDGLFDSP